MIKIEKTALVPFTARQMFQLVVDVESYPEFLPWCRTVEVHEREEGRVVASVELAKGKIHKRFTTENLLVENESIDMRLIEGPFRHLEGIWHFSPLGDEGSRVAFCVEFEFSSRIISATVGPIFKELADKLVDVFIKRARELYDEP